MNLTAQLFATIAATCAKDGWCRIDPDAGVPLLEDRLGVLVRAGLIVPIGFSSSGSRVLLTPTGATMATLRTVTPLWLSQTVMARHGLGSARAVADIAREAGATAALGLGMQQEGDRFTDHPDIGRMLTFVELQAWTAAYADGWRQGVEQMKEAAQAASEPKQIESKDAEGADQNDGGVNGPGGGTSVEFYLDSDTPVSLTEAQLQEGLVGDLLKQGAANFVRQGFVTKLVGDNAFTQTIDQRLAAGIEKGVGGSKVLPVPANGISSVTQLMNSASGLLEASTDLTEKFSGSVVKSAGLKFGQGASAMWVNPKDVAALKAWLNHDEQPAEESAKKENEPPENETEQETDKEAGKKTDDQTPPVADKEIGEQAPMQTSSMDYEQIDQLIGGNRITLAEASKAETDAATNQINQSKVVTVLGAYAWTTVDPEEVDRQAGFKKADVSIHLHVQLFVIPITMAGNADRWKAPAQLGVGAKSKTFTITSSGINQADLEATGKDRAMQLLKKFTIGNPNASLMNGAWASLWAEWKEAGDLQSISTMIKRWCSAPKAGQSDLDNGEQAASGKSDSTPLKKLLSTIKANRTDLLSVEDDLQEIMQQLVKDGIQPSVMDQIPAQAGIRDPKAADILKNALVKLGQGQPVDPAEWADLEALIAPTKTTGEAQAKPGATSNTVPKSPVPAETVSPPMAVRQILSRFRADPKQAEPVLREWLKNTMALAAANHLTQSGKPLTQADVVAWADPAMLGPKTADLMKGVLEEMFNAGPVEPAVWDQLAALLKPKPPAPIGG